MYKYPTTHTLNNYADNVTWSLDQVRKVVVLIDSLTVDKFLNLRNLEQCGN